MASFSKNAYQTGLIQWAIKIPARVTREPCHLIRVPGDVCTKYFIQFGQHNLVHNIGVSKTLSAGRCGQFIYRTM